MTKLSIFILLLVIISFADISAQTIIAPTELEAESEDSSYIKVKWRDNSGNEDGFYIERAQINDSMYWEIIDAVPQNYTQYFDYWAVRGVKYYYRVFAYQGQIRSGYSNVDSVILLGDPYIIPEHPTSLKVLDITMTSITIRWHDNSSNEDGFIIARKDENDLFFHYIDTVSHDILTYQEVGLTPDHVYSYKVCAFNQFGISDYTNTVSARTEQTMLIQNNSEIPAEYFLGNNYPNPFNPNTNIKFGIAKNSRVTITIFNSLGMEVEKLVDENLQAGTYNVVWDAHNFSSGVYFYKISVSSSIAGEQQFTEVKRMIFTK